ncbi:MAG: NPCBM/NEW2 domain-containing protein [Planctomycetaceae bacterium]|nr:NPCBM/NEW2 domain-containing protein [Planctomycetaceae bacterium]
MRLYNRSLPVLIVVLLCPAVGLRGDVLTTIDDETITGHVDSVDAGQLTVKVQKDDVVETQTIPLENLRHIRCVPELLTGDSEFELVIDNRRPEEGGDDKEHEASAKIKLRQGHHAFTLVYWQNREPKKFVMEVAGPGGEFEPITPEVLFRVPDGEEFTSSEGKDDEGFRLPDKAENLITGLDHEARKLGDRTVTSVAELQGLPQNSEGGRKKLDLDFRLPDENFAVIFRGFFAIPADGEYGAKLISTGNCQLFFGPTPAVLMPRSKDESEDKWRVKLRYGGNLDGNFKSWADDKCLIDCRVDNQSRDITIPAMELTELWATSANMDELKSERADEPTDLDSVYAKSKSGRVQRVSGTVLGIADEALRFEYSGKERTIALERVVGIVMRKPESGDVEADVAPHRFEFLSGASLPGRLTGINGEKLTIALPWGDALTPQRLDIRRIVIAQGRFQSLSTLDPVEVTQTPYFDRVLPMAIDKSLTGGTLQIGEKTYDRGICLPSRSVVSYDLSGEYARFRCNLGLQNIDGDAGNVSVKVMADDEVLLDISELTGKQEAQDVDLDVSGRGKLTLRVDFGKNLHIGDHVVWANAHLLRGEETP